MAKQPLRIRAYNIFVAGLKIGTLETSDYEIAGNDEQHITAEGVSYSDGTVTTKITGNTVVSVDGKTKRITQMILKKEYVQIQVGIVDGEIQTVTMRCTMHKFTTDYKTGSLKGSFEFGGGEPEIS
jgi:hypothetical protein